MEGRRDRAGRGGAGAATAAVTGYGTAAPRATAGSSCSSRPGLPSGRLGPLGRQLERTDRDGELARLGLEAELDLGLDLEGAGHLFLIEKEREERRVREGFSPCFFFFFFFKSPYPGVVDERLARARVGRELARRGLLEALDDCLFLLSSSFFPRECPGQRARSGRPEKRSHFFSILFSSPGSHRLPGAVAADDERQWLVESDDVL